jgi:hypothetical protein
MDTHVLYQAAISINQTAVADLASSFSKPVSQVQQTAISHELGHAVNLGHAPSWGACDSQLSIMNPTIDQSIICGLQTPTPCDGTNLETVYSLAGVTPGVYCPCSNGIQCVRE